ncbi:flagellar basal-body MS-ring/collar protein FliF [Arcobacter sp. 15-2]|uniref:flagellar basal-body MS-ring/collar protein FliF n=1 Tax=Arcobacter sp. 15-2 TaxID=3374109 RepID=UPI00399CB95C
MEQIFKFINNLNSAQRAVIIGGFSVLFLFLIGLLIYSNIKAKDEELNYTIATNLTKTQVMLASSELDASSIPYSIVGSGNNLTLKTNKNSINIAKIKLVTSDASTTKHTGWEIFDKSSLGTTNFENKVKYLRALEGELGRSLESISGILSASVKIAIPKESVFTQRKTDPTASAVLNLREGTALSQRQIEGIKNFIASAIPKLKPENIKLINQNGSLLENNPESMESLKYIEHEKYKTKLESDYENKIKDLLLPFLGDQRVVAKVSIELDFTKQEINQEIYEPEGTIRSQQTTEIAAQSDAKEPQTGGVPGAESNIEDPENDNSLKTKKTSKEEAKNVTNYEISKKIISQRNNAYAGISKITAAVTYDSAVLEKVENKEEFITSLNSIVQVAIGYRENRGDSVTVKSFKFIGLQPFGTKPEDIVSEEDSLGLFSTQAMVKEYGEYIQYLIAMILLFVFYKKFIANNEISLASGSGTSAGEGSDEYENLFDEFDARTEQSKLKAKVKSQILSNLDGLSAEESAKYEVLIEQIEKSVSDHPEDIAQMILMLLNEGGSKLQS